MEYTFLKGRKEERGKKLSLRPADQNHHRALFPLLFRHLNIRARIIICCHNYVPFENFELVI